MEYVLLFLLIGAIGYGLFFRKGASGFGGGCCGMGGCHDASDEKKDTRQNTDPAATAETTKTPGSCH